MANAINTAGTIVGGSHIIGDSAAHAFLFRAGAMTDLNSLVYLGPVSLTEAFGINDSGQIIAEGDNGHAYLLTPATSAVPEPSTYALFGAVTLVVLALSRRLNFISNL